MPRCAHKPRCPSLAGAAPQAPHPHPEPPAHSKPLCTLPVISTRRSAATTVHPTPGSILGNVPPPPTPALGEETPVPLHSSQGAAPPEPHWLYAELCPSALAQPPHGLPADLRGQRRRRGVLADQGAVGGCGRAGGQLGTGDMGRGWGCRGLTPGAPLSCTDHAKGAASACAHGPQAGCGPAGEGGLVLVPPIPHPHSSQLTPLQMHNGSNCICPARPGPPGPKVRRGVRRGGDRGA